MTLFTQLLSKLEQVEKLNRCVEGKKSIIATGLPSVNKANLILSVYENWDQKLILVLTPDEQSSKALCSDLNSFAGEKIAEIFSYRDLIIRPVETYSNEYEIKRLGVLSKIVDKKIRVVFSSVAAAYSHTMPKKVLENLSIHLEPGQQFSQNDLIYGLANSGYVKREQIDGIGQFAVRGALVDIYPASLEGPVRVEYWGDEIDSIWFFDLKTQRRTSSMKHLKICPASEFIFDKTLIIDKLNKILKTVKNSKAKAKIKSDIEKIQQKISIPNADKYIAIGYEKNVTIFDYFSDGIFIFSEQKAISKALMDEKSHWDEDLNVFLEEGDLCEQLQDCRPKFDGFLDLAYERGVFLENFQTGSNNLKLDEKISFETISLGTWSGERDVLMDQIKFYKEQGYMVIVMAGTQKAAKALNFDLESFGVVAPIVKYDSQIQLKGIYITTGAVSSGFEDKDAKFAVISVAQFKYRKTKPKNKSSKEKIGSLTDLNVGDLVVHSSYGIGRFAGIEKILVKSVEKDYIKIQYDGSNVLYVPVTQLDLVSRYMGAGDASKVRLSRLGTDDWTRAKRRVRKEADEMAKELIELYAKRQQTKGFAFSKDNDWMRNFEQHFEYEETQDQLVAIEEIKRDMESSRPMDRLVCGDVGFGKTEVSLRAAFKCVLDGKQCAFLCPTTILAWQHYQTIKQRIGNFPIKVELLSRFKTAGEQAKIIKKLKIGEVDIVVGTHRLVQKDIQFKDLGLAIIDEEQRFGVSQKEKFKKIFSGVDVLSLSATPIPRTLNMAMSGIRDMSVLEEPPQDRQPIQTYVMEYEPLVIAQAIRKELRRNGQVYYIHNRIQTISQCQLKIKNLIPGARIGVAHGQMDEKALSVIWKQVLNHEIDILICTTIIETGVDIPNANTMIIENSDQMGLAQLYQLRGRIGRAKRRAFAYFTFARGKVLSEIASQRLLAIREFTRFGSGFMIALKDLEIRGAGSLLGERQHGQMATVGYDMYIKILNEAVKKAQGKEALDEFVDCAIDVPISAHIPEKYIPNMSQRLEIYRKIASIENESQKMDLVDELIDRFGEPSGPVIGLMDVAILRSKASRLGFGEISANGAVVRFYPAKLDMEQISKIISGLGDRASFSAGQKPYLAVKTLKDRPLDVIKLVLNY